MALRRSEMTELDMEIQQLRQENAALRGELEKLNSRMCWDMKTVLAGNFCCAFHKEG